MSGGRPPNWDVTIGKRAEQGEKSFSRKVGAGWNNKAGGINLVLDPGVSISSPEGIQITLWPFKPKEERGAPPKQNERMREPGEDDSDDLFR